MNTVIRTPDGLAPAHFISPPQKEPRPAVMLYMDAFGIRPSLIAMAERLASHGYHVLLPDLYYRGGPSQPFDAAAGFNPGPQRDRLMALYQSLNNHLVMQDTAAFLDFLAAQPHVAPRAGCVGYCMGGGFALSAAGTFPDKIAAAAAFHGARLATDQPDSPHLLAPKMDAAIYVGIAGIDPHFTPEEKARLESALNAADVTKTVETYPNVKHGFAVTDHPAYDHAASELHWQRLLKLFAENLAPAPRAL